MPAIPAHGRILGRGMLIGAQGICAQKPNVRCTVFRKLIVSVRVFFRHRLKLQDKIPLSSILSYPFHIFI